MSDSVCVDDDAVIDLPTPLEQAAWRSFTRVTTAEQALKAAEADRRAAVSAWLRSLEGDAFWAAVTRLYWEHAEIDTKVLGDAAGLSPSQVSQHVGNYRSAIPCTRCGQGLMVTSREHVKTLRRIARQQSRSPYSWGLQCDDCQSEADAERAEHRAAAEAARDQRWHELRTMPYAEYLQTPEWQARRERMVKRSGYRCQLCNRTGAQLHVHHRTYERRGGEWDKDLIVLCKDCHGQFHATMKVVR